MTDDPAAGAPLEAPLPDHVKMSRDGLNLVLDVRWFRAYHVFSLLGAFAMGAFYYFTFLRSRAPSAAGLDWFTVLWFGGLSCGAYSGLAGIWNHTWVTVGDGAIDVRIGPLPWWGAKRIPSNEITQVYCDEEVRRRRGGSDTYYHVEAITAQNTNVRLVAELPAKDIALFIEQEIEKALGIADRKVPGEVQK